MPCASQYVLSTQSVPVAATAISRRSGSCSRTAAGIGTLLRIATDARLQARDDLFRSRVRVLDELVFEGRPAQADLRRDRGAVEEDDPVHDGPRSQRLRQRFASATIAAGVMPKCSYSASAGPEAPKPRHADESAALAEVAVPAEAQCGLDRDAHARRAAARSRDRRASCASKSSQHGIETTAVGMPSACSRGARLERERDFGAGREQRHLHARRLRLRPARRRRGATGSRPRAGAAQSAAPGARTPASPGRCGARARSPSTRRLRRRRPVAAPACWASRAATARISTGWCVGPFLPTPIESWLNTNFTGRPISAAMRIAGRS